MILKKIFLSEDCLFVFKSKMPIQIYLSSAFVDSGGVILEYFGGAFIQVF